jgi:hypothetical protein
MLRTDFDRAVSLIERHTGADPAQALAARLFPSLAVLAIGEAEAVREGFRLRATGEPAPWTDIEAACRQQLARVVPDLIDPPHRIAALIDDLAAMDPPYRGRRHAILTEAWADALTA